MTEAAATEGDVEAASEEPRVSKPRAANQFKGGDIDLQSLEILDISAKDHGYGSFEEYMQGHLREPGQPMDPRTEREFEKSIVDVEKVKVVKSSFWYDEDDPEMDCDEVEEFDEDDMTEMAHAKLEEIKEMRHYNRLAVWELPLLSKLAKPFVPPSENQPLRWRYTTYFGDTHPAEKKVVVQFAPDDLKLTQQQTEKLKKLAGTRYNPEMEIVKMSCESYEHQAQNKRYLLSVIDKLIAEAKDPRDTFEDVPLDTRHHQVKSRPRFPKEWLMTEERRRFLDGERERLKLAEVQRMESGEIVDGKQAIEGYLVEKMREEQEKAAQVAELVTAQPARSNARSSMGRPRRA